LFQVLVFLKMVFLHNNFLKVGIDPLGAELKSVTDGKREYMWSGDPAIWGRTAPVLFPIVGKANNNELLIGDKNYPISQHGFARDMEFKVMEQDAQHVVFSLTSSETTKEIYPYDFELRIGYALRETSVTCSYEVTNIGHQLLYFAIGAHPGFSLPRPDLNDYVIEFEQEESVPRYLLTEGLLNGKTEPVLNKSAMLPLDISLFDKDALVFKGLKSKRIAFKSKASSFKIEVEWDDFPYLGIWCKKACEEFICLEPWCGIAGSVGDQVDIKEKEGMQTLEAGGVFRRTYKMTFHS
jgi:galactose mutarotase-like enzyme